MRITRRGWIVIMLLAGLLGWLSGPWTYYKYDTGYQYHGDSQEYLDMFADE
jgi:hypothetical protein